MRRVFALGRPLGLAATVAVTFLAFNGCSTVKDVLGLPNPGDPSVNLKSAESRWLLVRNPRFGDVPSEPEYIWVEEDKVPTTFTTLLRGDKAIMATPEVVARYGPPPGGGKISPRQGVPYLTGAEAAAAAEAQSRAAHAAIGAVRPASMSPVRTAAVTPQVPVVPETKRGYVVYVDTTRIVVDLTPADGVRSGTLVSVRRDRIPIVHPVTGEMLGELDEEVGVARITETREKFSVAEIESIVAGSQILVKDRVVPK
jgi:hypothetical protein